MTKEQYDECHEHLGEDYELELEARMQAEKEECKQKLSNLFDWLYEIEPELVNFSSVVDYNDFVRFDTFGNTVYWDVENQAFGVIDQGEKYLWSLAFKLYEKDKGGF